MAPATFAYSLPALPFRKKLTVSKQLSERILSAPSAWKGVRTRDANVGQQLASLVDYFSAPLGLCATSPLADGPAREVICPSITTSFIRKSLNH